jgi:hypothetical protein
MLPAKRGVVCSENIGAGNEARTRDLNLGKVALYQLSYSRTKQTRNCRAVPLGVKKKSVKNAAKALNWPRISAFDRLATAPQILASPA